MGRNDVRDSPARRWMHPRARTQTGAAALEFALVLPVLMSIVFGIIQFGFVMTQSAALDEGARGGARYGVVNLITPHTCSGLVANVRAGASTIGMQGANVAVTVARGTTPALATTVCSSAAGSATVTNSSVAPCTTTPQVDNNSLYVTTAYTSMSIVPIGVASFSLNGAGNFRCEYK